MISINFKKEQFFLISLFIWFFVGYPNFLNVLMIFQFVLIFFFLDFKINYLKFVSSLLMSIFLLGFAENIDAFKLYLIFIIIILSLDFENKTKNNFNLKELIIFLLLFLFLIIYKSDPHTSNPSTIYKLKEDVKILENNKLNLESKTYKKGLKIYAFESSCPALCDIEIKSCDKKRCDIKNNFIKNRFTINNVDVNFVSLIFMSLVFVMIYNTGSNKNFLFILYFVTGILIIFLTKSRSSIIFFLISNIMFFYKNFGLKQILFSFLILQIFLIFLGYLMTNSVEDPMRMFSPTISENGIYKFSISGNNDDLEIFRLITIFDQSNFIRFSTYFQTFLIYINDFPKILFPDHSGKILEIIYETHVGEKLLITQDDYHPHNLMMGIIREAGLIYCIFFYYLIFSHFSHDNFKIIIIPLIFSTIFLGISVLFLIPTILIFSFKTKNNFSTIKEKLKL